MDHVDDITMKTSRRIYLLKQLKRVGIDRKSDCILLCAHKFRSGIYMSGTCNSRVQNSRFWTFSEGAKRRKRDHRV